MKYPVISVKMIVVAVFCLMLVSMSAQVAHVETNITMRNELGKYATVICGVDSAATNGIDAAMGEVDIPGFPPTPSGLQAAFAYKDNDGSSVLSYRNIRKMPVGKRVFCDTLRLLITPATDESRGSVVSFTWAFPLDRSIDSIIVEDTFGGTIKKVFFDSREADTLKNNEKNLESFVVRIYYNIKDPVSVESEQSMSNADFIRYSNAKLHFDQSLFRDGEQWDLQVSNITGQTVLLSELKQTVSVESLTNGTYVATLLNRQHPTQSISRVFVR